VDVPVEIAARLSIQALASSLIAAFFAFGGWWEFGRMSEDVDSPRRTIPRALIGGIAIVTAIYALASVAYSLARSGLMPGTDEAFVALIGLQLFGAWGGRLLATMVVDRRVGKPRRHALRLASALRGHGAGRSFSAGPCAVDARRGSVPASTLVQVALASLLVALGSFNDILGYFIPCAVFFLGLSASAILFLPRTQDERQVFEAPTSSAADRVVSRPDRGVLALFVLGQPKQTLLGAVVVMVGMVVSRFVVPRRITMPS
jgi:APA family basic amino acid/polyamine antiporter